MKFSTIFSAAAAMMFAGVDAASPATLAQKWNISDDITFEYSGLSFELGYYISDYIANDANSDMVRVNLFDQRCKEEGIAFLGNGTDGIENIFLDASAVDTTLVGTYVDPPTDEEGLLMDRLVTVNITIDSETISANSLLYSEDTRGSQVTAEIRFCVRFGLHTKSVTSVEVNFLETLVTLNVDLTDGFEIGSIAVEPRDRLVRTANQVYLIQAYRCDENDVEIVNAAPINQGTVVKVCVLPDQDALNDGIKMRSIDDFTWQRTSPNVVNQPAIIGPNKKARNDLTSISCTPGERLCSFETILFAAFYTQPGAVAGSGVASMQFGTVDNGPEVSRRGLRGDDERMLQNDEPAAAAEFELDFDVAQATPYGTSGAASFGVMASTAAAVLIAAIL